MEPSRYIQSTSFGPNYDGISMLVFALNQPMDGHIDITVDIPFKNFNRYNVLRCTADTFGEYTPMSITQSFDKETNMFSLSSSLQDIQGKTWVTCPVLVSHTEDLIDKGLIKITQKLKDKQKDDIAVETKFEVNIKSRSPLRDFTFTTGVGGSTNGFNLTTSFLSTRNAGSNFILSSEDIKMIFPDSGKTTCRATTTDGNINVSLMSSRNDGAVIAFPTSMNHTPFTIRCGAESKILIQSTPGSSNIMSFSTSPDSTPHPEIAYTQAIFYSSSGLSTPQLSIMLGFVACFFAIFL